VSEEGPVTSTSRSPGRDRLEAAEGCLYRLIADSCADWEYLLDPDDRIVWVSPSCEPITGHSPDEFLIDPGLLDSVVHPEDRALFAAHQLECRKSDESDDATFRILRPDGALRWIGHRCRPFAFPGGTSVGRRCSNQDITALKKAEERLRLQLTVLQSAANGIVITGRDGTIQWVNPAFTLLTGYSAAEAIGKNPRILKSGRQGDAFYKALWETIVAGSVWQGEIVNRRKDGSLYTEEMTIAPVTDAGGSITHFVAIKQDVTARKQAEERLRELNETLEQRVAERTAEAEERAVQVRALAAELSQAERKEHQRLAKVLHDHLQQILVAAKFNVDALLGRVREDDLRPLALRINDLIDESIAECRSLTVSLSPPVLQEAGLLAGLGWLARRMQEQHGLRVDLSVSGDYVEPADADVKAFLFDATRELLFNVVKHSGALEARIALSRAEGDVQLRIEDQGRGLDQETPLHRRDEAEGFGLFSIKHRLDLIGGLMKVEGAPGQGTRVMLLAPAGPIQEKAAAGTGAPAGAVSEEVPLAPKTSVRSGRIRVVIADDHRILRQGLIALIRVEKDIDVVGEAADGVEAVELARSLRPDVIIMDVSMPKMNGIDATRQIVAELPNVRIVGLSMHEDETIAASMREAGAVDFVTKGGRSDALISAIRAAVRAHSIGRAG
jgi:PAS domain S-box-containing protein